MLNYGIIYTIFIKGVSLMGIEHLGIVSKDTLRLKNWYQEIFGGDVVYDNGKGTYFLAFEDKSMIEFVMATDDKPEDVEKSGSDSSYADDSSIGDELPTEEVIVNLSLTVSPFLAYSVIES